MKVFWNGTDDRQAAEKMLKWIPDDFDGKILDVPYGTCVFTEEKWNHLKQAETRVHDVHFLQGDVSVLPFENAFFSLVVSMNGFHAFSDKQKAFMKIYRVLKPGGRLIGCFYVYGKAETLTSWFSMYLRSTGGSPPFL